MKDRLSPNLKARAIGHIQHLLLSGELTWGDRVSEEAIARKIGMSRTPVREALHRFTELGIFERVHRSGTVVRIPEVREIEELFEIRIALESYALSRGIHFFSVNELAALEKSCAEVEAILVALRKVRNSPATPAQLQKLFEADLLFHSTIIAAPGNLLLIKQIEENRMLARINGGTHLPRFGELRIVELLEDHRRIYEAICNRNTDLAVNLLVDHIRKSKEGVIVHLRKDLDAIAQRPLEPESE